MRGIDAWFARYGESHRHPVNEAIHRVCVPLISWSALGLLWAWTPVATVAAILLAMAFYAPLSRPLAAGMLASTALMAATFPLAGPYLTVVAAAAFVAGWVGQFIGHRIEGRRPSFLQDVQFLLVGPAWVLAQLYRKLGLAY